MKASKFIFFVGFAVIGFMMNATTNGARGQQYVHYEPRYASEIARQNHIHLTSLHFCPRWYETLYCGQQYKLMNANVRLVLKITDDGEAILNPKIEPLGGSLDTIDLNKIDEATAKNLWSGRTNREGVITCDLLTELGSSEMDIFHLDMKFANDRISSYRLRGSGILKPDWVGLNAANSGERMKSPSPERR